MSVFNHDKTVIRPSYLAPINKILDVTPNSHINVMGVKCYNNRYSQERTRVKLSSAFTPTQLSPRFSAIDYLNNRFTKDNIRV